MPKRAWSAKREREYEHIRAGLDDLSSGRRGGLRSRRGEGGRTRDQLYNEPRKQNIPGRSKMTKAQLQRAVDGWVTGRRGDGEGGRGPGGKIGPAPVERRV